MSQTLTIQSRWWDDPILRWIALGLLGFVLLPWNALEYGVFDATYSEFVAAWSWTSFKSSAFSIFCLILIAIRPWRGMAKADTIDSKVFHTL